MVSFQKCMTLASSIFGMATIIVGIVMLFAFPISADLSAGFRTPIIAFEFAKTEADLSFLSGSSELNRLNREKMDAGHFWDMGFPFAYGGFIALMLLQIAERGHRFAWLGVLFAVSIIPFDINENLTLLQISHCIDHLTVEYQLHSPLNRSGRLISCPLELGTSGTARLYRSHWNLHDQFAVSYKRSDIDSWSISRTNALFSSTLP